MLIDTERLTDILLEAPGWARVGLTARDARLREAAAETLANTIVERLNEPDEPIRDARQMVLPILS